MTNVVEWPVRGGGMRRVRIGSAAGVQNAICGVPSPLEGEGQGGGAAAVVAQARRRIIAETLAMSCAHVVGVIATLPEAQRIEAAVVAASLIRDGVLGAVPGEDVA